MYSAKLTPCMERALLGLYETLHYPKGTQAATVIGLRNRGLILLKGDRSVLTLEGVKYARRLLTESQESR